jgi:peptidoglycan/xylan/chitin deacetylase (PgdA/CDA1 family)
VSFIAVHRVRSLAFVPALAGLAAVSGVAAGTAGRPVLAAGAVPAAAVVTKPVPSGLGGQDWTEVKASSKIVALTFDAGANADGVSSILSTLRADHVPATFMLTGAFARDFPGKARDIVRAGELVGDHSMTHPDFTTLTDSQIRAQVLDARKEIIAVTGADPWPWFRFPYGARNTHTISVVNSVGFAAVRWTVDTLGWKGTKPSPGSPDSSG